METTKIKQKALIISLILIILLATLASSVTASPVKTSESATVKAAKSWTGVKVVHAGNSRSGIDCSHLVYQVYKQVGVKSIVFETVAKMKKDKYYVTTKSPRPGDVIFWKKVVTKNGTKYWLDGHVGIYIGNGQFIHASNEVRKVTTDSITDIYKDGMPYYARWSHP
jgi:cell wall-associated NlpC family hydrolase